MSVCRICLCSNPKKDLSQIKCRKNDELTGEYIILVCLGIQIIQEAGESTKFCTKCFKKVIEFHQFKSLALKNEAILRSLGIKEFLKNDVKTEDSSEASSNECYDEPLVDVLDIQECKQEEHPPGSPFQCIVTQEANEKEYQKEPPIECIKSQLHLFEVPVRKDFEEEDQLDNKPLGTEKKHVNNCIPSTTLSEKKNYVVCNECGLKFVSKNRLTFHLKTHKPKVERTKVQCAHCDKEFLTKDILKRHIWNIHPEGKTIKQHKCELCHVSYGQKKSLWRHQNKMHGGVKIQCPVCKEYYTGLYMDTHIRTRHQPESLPYECEVCKYRFVSRTLLKRHTSVHSKEKTHPCEICGAKFRLKYSVTLHRRQVHEKQKDHVCHICSKRFFTNSKLQKHIRRHASNDTKVKVVVDKKDRQVNRKLFTCPDCGKPLATERSLKLHRELHTGKKYNCKLCTSTFASKRYVLVHMKTHYQVRKFACKFCSATFVRSAARRRHELEIHLEPGKRPVKKYKRKNRPSRSKKKLQPVQPIETSDILVKEQPYSDDLDSDATE